jgi:hypothetical protein
MNIDKYIDEAALKDLILKELTLSLSKVWIKGTKVTVGEVPEQTGDTPMLPTVTTEDVYRNLVTTDVLKKEPTGEGVMIVLPPKE